MHALAALCFMKISTQWGATTLIWDHTVDICVDDKVAMWVEKIMHSWTAMQFCRHKFKIT